MPFNYEAPSYTHTLNDQSVTVRGLNVDDLSYLIQQHGALIELVFDGEPNPLEIIMKAPALAADVIACAADDRDAVHVAARMPLGLQIRLLAKVFELSMHEADMGNVLGAVVRMLKTPNGPESPTNHAI